jgi:hypothetical protein
MAQRTTVVLVDDLDGIELPEGQGQTIRFSLDGTSYEIDLSKKNADMLRRDVKRYTEAARRVGRQVARGAPAVARKNTADIRAWAKANGHEINDRGRIPTSVVEAYEAASA